MDFLNKKKRKEFSRWVTSKKPKSTSVIVYSCGLYKENRQSRGHFQKQFEREIRFSCSLAVIKASQ
jgi:hypothetical protein